LMHLDINRHFSTFEPLGRVFSNFMKIKRLCDYCFAGLISVPHLNILLQFKYPSLSKKRFHLQLLLFPNKRVILTHWKISSSDGIVSSYVPSSGDSVTQSFINYFLTSLITYRYFWFPFLRSRSLLSWILYFPLKRFSTDLVLDNNGFLDNLLVLYLLSSLFYQ
jgi:hypothetical protein